MTSEGKYRNLEIFSEPKHKEKINDNKAMNINGNKDKINDNKAMNINGNTMLSAIAARKSSSLFSSAAQAYRADSESCSI